MRKHEMMDSTVETAAEEHGHARVYEAVPADGGTLSAENRHYLERVLRVRPGDGFQITDGAGREASAVLQAGGAYRLGELREMSREPAVEVTLFVSLIKGDRFEMVIEKAVELGVCRIIPVVTSRCVARPPAPGKLDRWRKIALAAMLQCGGCRVPEVADPVAMRDLPAPGEEVRALLLHEDVVGDSGGTMCSQTASSALRAETRTEASRAKTWVFSGPEGGFSDAEVSSLVAAGWCPTWLGPRRLRADTAPITALAVLTAGSLILARI